MLRRSSAFASEVLEVFDRSLTERELVSQSKALCRDYILSRLQQNGLGWSKTEVNFSPSTNAALADVSLVLICLGKAFLPSTGFVSLCFSFIGPSCSLIRTKHLKSVHSCSTDNSEQTNHTVCL